MQLRRFLLRASAGLLKGAFLYLGCLLLVSAPVLGQAILLDKAADFARQKDFQKAREAIDLASATESNAKDARTWYLKGFIYKELYRTNPNNKEDLRKAALGFLQKSLLLDDKKQYKKNAQTAIRNICITYFNDAIGYFNQHRYQEALNDLQTYLKVLGSEPPDDSYAEALYYAGYANGLLGKSKEAIRHYEQALQLSYENPLLYRDLSQLYNETGKDSLALKTVTAGRRLFPKDTTLRIVQINVLLSTNNFVKAEKEVEDYLMLDPRNIEVLLVAGTVYEKIALRDSLLVEPYFIKRKDVFSRALAIEPDNFSANYNMGITLYNRGVDLIKSQPSNLDIVLLFDVLEKVSVLFKESRPYVEKAYRFSPNSRDAMRALEGIYYNLNEKEKSKQMRNKLNEMK